METEVDEDELSLDTSSGSGESYLKELDEIIEE